MDRRLRIGAFFGIWILLFCGQIAALSAMADPADPSATGLAPPAVAAIVGLLQLAKLPITAWRLNDLGRPPSDALFFCLLPVANVIGLLRFMPERTPSDAVRERRRRAWTEQLGPLAALGEALPLLGRTAAIGIPAATLYALVLALGAQAFLQLLDYGQQIGPDTRTLIGQTTGSVAALLGLYTLIQIGKRHTASRISWVPSLLLLPVSLIASGFLFFDRLVESQLQILLLLFFSSAWYAFWMSFGGAALMVAVTLAAERARNGEPIEMGPILEQVRRRTLDVAAPHGTRVQAIMVGNQVVIPGIFYMLQLAFADTIAVLKPDGAALKESSQLTWGMRGRLFKLFLVVIVLTLGAQFGAMALIDGQEPALAYFFDPRALSLGGLLAGEAMWAYAAWWTQVALLLMYHDRVAYLRRRRDERKRKQSQKQPDQVPEAPDQERISPSTQPSGPSVPV